MEWPEWSEPRGVGEAVAEVAEGAETGAGPVGVEGWAVRVLALAYPRFALRSICLSFSLS